MSEELSKAAQDAVRELGERLQQGPRTLNELHDWWVKERGKDPSVLRQAQKYLIGKQLIEPRQLGKVKLLALPGQHHKPKGSPIVASTPAAAPPPVPAPPAPPPASTSERSASAPVVATTNVGSPPEAATGWIPVPELAKLLGISAVSVAEAVSRRRRQGKVIDHIVLPGKGKPRAFRRAHVELWLAERNAGVQLAADVAADVQRSNGKRAAIEDALYAGTGEMTRTQLPASLDVQLPELKVGDVLHVPGKNQKGVVRHYANDPEGKHSLHLGVTADEWKVLQALCDTGLWGALDPDALADQLFRESLRRNLGVARAWARAVSGR